MARRGCVLMQSRNGWKLAAAGAPDCAIQDVSHIEPTALAEAVAAYLRQHKLSARTLLIALHSDSVLTGEFDPPVGRRNRTTLSYAFEPLLPYAAEDVVADFVDRGASVFGLAVVSAELAPIVEACESRGLRVCSIVPAAMLAIQSLARETQLNDFDWVVWESGSCCELVQLVQGQVSGWQRLSVDPTTLRRFVAMQLIRAGSRIRAACVGLSPEVLDVIGNFEEIDTTLVATAPIDDHVVNVAATVLAGRQAPIVELRREALADADRLRSLRGGITCLLLSTAVLLLTISGVNWSKVLRQQDQVRQLRELKVSEFRRAFPTTPVPAAIVSRLESEHVKLRGSHTVGAQVAIPTPALNVLLQFLRGLPQGQRGMFHRVRIENGALDAEVDLPSHAAADRLAASLREQGFEIDPPTTSQNDDDTVVARLYARMQLQRPRRDGE